ncbi:hypothetical protein VDG1235_699 [Verrucomicrobiia bacterium DG1235]|nr:hypothetical protein VDG1235_699 [Verrucomicrobiae bacterium DG1235]
MSHTESKLTPVNRLSIEDAQGEELLDWDEEENDQVVIATDARGNSLTLLEEYSQRKKGRISPTELTFSFACAAASLAFAVLIYFNTH